MCGFTGARPDDAHMYAWAAVYTGGNAPGRIRFLVLWQSQFPHLPRSSLHQCTGAAAKAHPAFENVNERV